MAASSLTSRDDPSYGASVSGSAFSAVGACLRSSPLRLPDHVLPRWNTDFKFENIELEQSRDGDSQVKVHQQPILYSTSDSVSSMERWPLWRHHSNKERSQPLLQKVMQLVWTIKWTCLAKPAGTYENRL